MFKSYFVIAWRSLKKNKFYSLINIGGLTIGLTSCILIGLYVYNELSYDRFHENADRIARITMDYGQGGTVNKVALTGTKTGPQLTRTLPGIEKFVRTIKTKRIIGNSDKAFDESNVLYADSSFFELFSFRLLQGNVHTALERPDNIVITQKMAAKYFGHENPIGQRLRIAATKDFIVSAVAANVPGNSQVQFDFIIPFNNLRAAKNEEWWSANYITYLLLQPSTSIPGLQRQVTQYMEHVCKDEMKMTGTNYLTYHLEPLKSVHLYSSLDGLGPNGNIIYVYVLGIIATLILIIASVNYTNLATAQAAGKGTEVGIRKVLGARPSQLFRRFIGESFILVFIALVLSVAISSQLLGAFNTVSGKALTAGLLFKPIPLLSLLVLCLLISFFAGAYPAFVLSNSKLVSVLKSGFRVSSSGSGLRKSLIVFQFAISAFLIIATIVVLRQLSYIQHKDLGYNKDHIIVLPVDNKMADNYDAIKKAIALNPDVVSISGGYETPTYVKWGDGITGETAGGKKEIAVNATPVDLDFIKTMGIQIVAGTDYTMANLQLLDTSNNYKNYRYSFILNENAVRKLGWTPREAIGKTIGKGNPGTITAVVKDFHYSSLHSPIGPFVIFLDPTQVQQLFVKISGQHIPATLQFIEKTWKERVTHRPFEYHFLDEEYDALYATEQRTAKVFGLFAGLAILLACLGLFALAAYTTAQRTKEIGIRKVLGAGVANITFLISKDFIRLVLVAILIASPLAWFATHKWLQDFAYRINVSWWIFIAAALVISIIALATVSFQAIKAALMNPVESLRSE